MASDTYTRTETVRPAWPETRTDGLRAFLTWTRSNGFRVSEIEMDGVKLKVDDLRCEGAAEAAEKPPRSLHEQVAREMGIDYPDLDELDEEEAAS